MAISSDIIPVIPSGSTNGRLVEIVATATAGTPLATATAVADEISQIILHAVTTDGSDHTLTVEWGGTGTANQIVKTIYANDGLQLVINGRLRGGLTVAAFADTASVINVQVQQNTIDTTP